MRKTLVFVAALALTPLALLMPNLAEACSCMRSPDALTAARDADAVFVGKLVSVETPAPAGPHDLPMKVFTFDVSQTLKGQLDARVRVESAESSAACGRDYGKVGETWLLYSRIDDRGQLHDNICSRTTPLGEAAADLAELEANKDTLDQPNPKPVPEPDDTVGAADPEPEPVEAPLPDTGGEPEPVPPTKKGCSVGGEPIEGLALLALLGLPWSRSRRRRLGG